MADISKLYVLCSADLIRRAVSYSFLTLSPKYTISYINGYSNIFPSLKSCGSRVNRFKIHRQQISIHIYEAEVLVLAVLICLVMQNCLEFLCILLEKSKRLHSIKGGKTWYGQSQSRYFVLL